MNSKDESDLEMDPRDLSREQFRRELDKWFRSRGVIADLRSHLRHSMIMALQNTPMGPKSSTEEASPKAQALNLLVAEHLLRRRCHYTLSVLASEMPNLSGFCSAGASLGRKSSRANAPEKCDDEGNAFQESEIQEIFNALGFSSCVSDLKRLKINYSRETNKDSLLELLLQLMLEVLVKLDVQENAKSLQVPGSKGSLSAKWTSDLVDVLLSEKINPHQIASLQNSIFSITEIELRRLTEEERRKQLEMLTEREKRIQDHLRRCQEGICVRLMQAEKDLILRKDFIDEELSQRQRHLSKMALEWNEKHQEIVGLCKKFYNLRDENEALRKEVDETKRENENLRVQDQNRIETIDRLRVEIDSLRKKLKRVSESNSALRKRYENPLSRRDHAQEIATTTVDKGLTEQVVDCGTTRINVENCRGIEKEEEKSQTKSPFVTSQDGGDGDDQEAEEEGEEASSSQSSSEELVSIARRKFQYLEEESRRINKNYLEYKSKYGSMVVSDAESSNRSSDEGADEEEEAAEFTVKLTKFSQTEKENGEIEETEGGGERIAGRKKDAETKSDSERSPENVFTRLSIRKSPSKRQLENRDFFLKSRKLLEEFEKGNSVRTTASPSSNSTSVRSSISGSAERISRSGEKPKKKENEGKFASEEQILNTPLRTASFYCNEIPPEDGRGKAAAAAAGGTPGTSKALAAIDLNCLALLNETKIKCSPVKRPLLRQQMLAESDEEKLVDRPEKEVKTIKSPATRSAASPADSTSGEKMSAGRDSGSGHFW